MTADQTVRPSLARVSRIREAGRDSSWRRATCASFFARGDASRLSCVCRAWACLRRPNPPLRRPCVGAWASYPVAALVGMAWALLRRQETRAKAVVRAITLQVGRPAVLRAAQSKRSAVAPVLLPLVALHVRARADAPGVRCARINVLPLVSEPGRAVCRATCTARARRMCAREPAELGAAVRRVPPGAG